MKALMAIQRQVQDLIAAMVNQTRVGKITEVKFDKENRRWMVKMTSGTGEEAFKSAWLPWKSFSNGAIKISLPPKVDQVVKLTSLGGRPELGHVEAYHNDPDNQSPHDKEDEFFIRIEKPSKGSESGKTKAETLDLHFTKDGSTVSIGDTTHKMSKDTISNKTKTNEVEAETDKSKSKTHQVETENRSVQAKVTTIKSDSYSLGGKVLINC